MEGLLVLVNAQSELWILPTIRSRLKVTMKENSENHSPSIITCHLHSFMSSLVSRFMVSTQLSLAVAEDERLVLRVLYDKA